jgi:hypothetical protein
VYGQEDVQLETVTKDPTQAELACVFALPRPGPEEAVIQCAAQSSAPARAYQFDALTLTRLP